MLISWEIQEANTWLEVNIFSIKLMAGNSQIRNKNIEILPTRIYITLKLKIYNYFHILI